MKTPHEKAEELVANMLGCSPTRQDGISIIDTIQAKLCAKIAVEEIIKTEPTELSYMEYGSMSYWQEVLNCLNRM
jgi:hypothetical protein